MNYCVRGEQADLLKSMQRMSIFSDTLSPPHQEYRLRARLHRPEYEQISWAKFMSRADNYLKYITRLSKSL